MKVLVGEKAKDDFGDDRNNDRSRNKEVVRFRLLITVCVVVVVGSLVSAVDDSRFEIRDPRSVVAKALVEGFRHPRRSTRVLGYFVWLSSRYV
jgi:hypothetical protein